MRSLTPLAEDITHARHLLTSSLRELRRMKDHAHELAGNYPAMAAHNWRYDVARLERVVEADRGALDRLQHPGRRSHVTEGHRQRRGHHTPGGEGSTF